MLLTSLLAKQRMFDECSLSFVGVERDDMCTIYTEQLCISCSIQCIRLCNIMLCLHVAFSSLQNVLP